MSLSQPEENAVDIRDAYTVALHRLTLQQEQIVLLEAQIVGLKREVTSHDEGGVVQPE